MSYEEDRVAFQTAKYNFGSDPRNDLVRLEPEQTCWRIFTITGNSLVGTVAPSKIDRSKFIATLYSSRDARISEVNPLKAATNVWNAHLERKATEKIELEEARSTTSAEIPPGDFSRPPELTNPESSDNVHTKVAVAPLTIHENISVEELARLANPTLCVPDNLQFLDTFTGENFVDIYYLVVSTTTVWKIIFDIEPGTLYLIARPGAIIINRRHWWNQWASKIPSSKIQSPKKIWKTQIMSYNRADGVNIGRSDRDPTKWLMFDHDGTSYSFVAREFHPNYGVLIDDLEGPLWTSFETAMETLKTVESVATEPYERI